MQGLHNFLMTMNQCVVLDIETTGFSPKAHAEIIEIGAVKLNIPSKKIIGRFNQRIQPSETFSISQKITDITGIAWEDIKDKPFIEQVLPQFGKFIGDLPVVAHNASFDWLRFFFFSFEMDGLHKLNNCICTMNLAKDLFPERERGEYNLESLCQMYGYEIQNHHNAYSDTLATASLFLKLLEKYRQVNGRSVEAAPVCKKVGMVDFQGLAVRRISDYKGASKRHGHKIYVTTNLGRIAYSVRRKLWTCVDLWADEDAPVREWGEAVLKLCQLSTEEFVKKYAESG